MSRIRVNGTELYYEKHGCGQSAVILVHGFLGSSRMWREYYVPHLQSAFRVYTIDMRGHGESRHIKTGCNVVQLAEDVSQFAQQLGVGRFHYIGMSMGGAIGLQLALAHPETLSSLVLMNSGFGSTLSRQSALTTFLISFLAQKQWFLKMLLQRILERPLSGELRQAFLEDAALVTKETWIEYTHLSNKIQQLERLRSFEAPTLIMIAGKDVLPLEKQHRLEELLPNARKVVFENEGHAMVLENPKAMLTQIIPFLTQ